MACFPARRETDVLRLVAEVHFLSRHTVQAHLRTVFGKHSLACACPIWPNRAIGPRQAPARRIDRSGRCASAPGGVEWGRVPSAQAVSVVATRAAHRRCEEDGHGGGATA